MVSICIGHVCVDVGNTYTHLEVFDVWGLEARIQGSTSHVAPQTSRVHVPPNTTTAPPDRLTMGQLEPH